MNAIVGAGAYRSSCRAGTAVIRRTTGWHSAAASALHRTTSKILCCLSRAIWFSCAVLAPNACGAGGFILPRRSRPSQAHASCRSPERRLLPRAVLTRRAGLGYPAPRCRLTQLLASRIAALHRLDRNPGRCARPPKRSATTFARRHTTRPCAASRQRIIGYRTP